MAYRDVQDWHRRSFPRRHPPGPLPVADHDWLSAADTTFDSLPYRRPKDLIQGPDEITSSPGRSRSSRHSSRASATVVETMPILPRNSTTAAYRRGRYPVPAYEYDPYVEEEPPIDPRRRSPMRGRSPISDQHLKSRLVFEPRRSSTSSPSRSDSESDDDSATSVSTQEEKRQRRHERARRVKERQDKHPRRPAPEERRRPSGEKKPKRRRKIREIVYVEEDDESTDSTPRQSHDERSSSPPRQRHRLSRSASERRHSRHPSPSPVGRSSHHRSPKKTYHMVSKLQTSKRLAYDSHPDHGDSDPIPSRHPRRQAPEVMYDEPRMIRRSNTATGASHITSYSATPIRKRSSGFLNRMAVGRSHSHSPEKPVKLVKCLVCTDEFLSSQGAKLSCSHRMCDSCLKWAFEISVSDPQHMPPKCCASIIPIKHVEHLLSGNFKMEWNRKYWEYSTRNRINCPSRRCGELIRPQDISRKGGRKFGRCSQCNTEVCCSCKGRWHSSRDCPEDEDTTRFLEQAKEAGWQRCYKCRSVVELEEGCNHMTCRCGAQFCMICGVKWKGCDCPWFNHETEDREANGLAALQRLDRLDLNANARGMRPRIEAAPPPRSRSQDHDDRLARRFRENRDDELTRRLPTYEDHDYERGYGNAVATTGYFMAEDYRREEDDVFVPGPPVPPAPTPPAAFERPTPADYMSGINRARGLPHDSMGQRLAERLSEFRPTPGGTRSGGTTAPPPPHPGPPLPPMTASPPMTAPLGLGHAPPIPMLRRHTMEEDMYNMARATRPSERVVAARMAHDYEAEAAVHAPRIRRRPHAEPKSSTLAGLTGPGRGMNRVYEWRHHVQPGMPDPEYSRADYARA